MIEILKVKEIQKGCFQYIVDLKITNWKLILHGVSIFKKGDNRWVNMPQVNYEANGESKFFPQVRFDDGPMNNAFQKSVLESLDKYLKENKVESKKAEPAAEFKNVDEEDSLPF